MEIYTRHVVASIAWLYSLIQLFIFDIDAFAIRHLAPSISWLFSYKFVVLLCVIALFWLLGGRKRLIVWAAYVVGYPVVLLSKTAYLIWKSHSWVVLIGLINVGLSIWRSFKVNFFVATITAVAVCVCLLAPYRDAIAIAAVVLLLVIVTLLVRSAISVFTPSHVYTMHAKLASVLLKGTDGINLPPLDTRNVALSQVPEGLREKWIEGLQTAVLYNRAAYFLSTQLVAYGKSRVAIFFHVLNFMALGLIVLLVLTVINFATFKIQPSGFLVHNSPNFFDFFYYTFNSMIGNKVDDLLPVGWVERTLNMGGVLFALALSGFLLTLLFSVRLQRDSDEILDAARDVRAQADSIEEFILRTFNLSVTQALVELELAKSGLIQLLFFLQREIK